MRILLVAEGEHEFGGALENLTRRLLPAGTTLSQVEKLKISDPALGHATGKGPKLTRRIHFAMHKAAQLGCDALVLLVDEDGDRDRRKYVDQAQKSADFSVQRAVGIAIRTFDAWMLADETAISHALGATIACQPSPEEIPKPEEAFAALHQGANCALSIGEAYAAIAHAARTDILEKQCPHGFAPFAKRVGVLHEPTHP